MNRQVQVYIEGQRLELFNNEQIQVTSTQQNVTDISKTYTDFSQSFTVPASPHNNAVLQHFYQNDVDATIDHNIRRNSFIEIELSFFRRGKMQIEKSQIKNGAIESYTLGFFGDGKTLLDYFGEDLLSDLDYTEDNHEYTGNEIKARIEDGTNAYNVKYPLISSKRVWTYAGTPPTNITPAYFNIPTAAANDIGTTTGSINYRELFPALRVQEIFKRISQKYNVTFNGNFLSDDRFTKLFLWYKNRNELNFFSQAVNLTIDTVTTPSNFANGGFNTTNNSIELLDQGVNAQQHFINFFLTLSSPAQYALDVYQNGNLYVTLFGSASGFTSSVIFQNTVGLFDTLTFKIRTNAVINVNIDINYSVSYIVPGFPLQTLTDTAICDVITTTLFTDLASLAPVMKISEFFSGICKAFNLTCYSTAANQYQLEPLDDWYSAGAIVDITEYTDVNSIDIDRMKLYKKISMQYQPSECFLNKQFSQLFSRDYGNTSYQYNYDGDEYTLQVPFENLLQTKFSSTNLQVGYSLNNEFAPYIPKPVLLYQYENQVVDFDFNNGGTTSTIINYTPFGQDLYANLTNYTLNFAPDISTILNQPVQQTLFATYYFSYLYNLYNLKQRLVSIKTILPISLLTGLQLNDRLVIRDKRYMINSMQSNLTTGEVNFQLIHDFRPMVNATQTPNVGIAGGDINIAIDFVNGTEQASITTGAGGVTISPALITAEQTVRVTLPAGAAGTVYPISVRYTLFNGNTEQKTINIIQK